MQKAVACYAALLLLQASLGARVSTDKLKTALSTTAIANSGTEGCDAKAMAIPLGVVKYGSSKLRYNVGDITYDRDGSGQCRTFTCDMRLGRIKMWVYVSGTSTLADESCCAKKEADEAKAKEQKAAQELESCVAGETYGLDIFGACRPDRNNDGNLDQDVLAPEACCLNCKPDATYGRDDQGLCRTDINNNGVLDRFASGECCDCDPAATYGRDENGRCRTDINRNGLLDRFAKSVCCGIEDLYKPETTYAHYYNHPTYGEITTKEQCESRDLLPDRQAGMSTRNKRDCVACVTEGSKDIQWPERCVTP